MKRTHFTNRRWHCSAMIGLLMALTTWTSAWPLGPLGAGGSVTVDEGQLSVDLWQAQVRDVLAAISQQAGLRMHVDIAANSTVNAQFTDLELDQGLRRLLRAASLNYALLYARGPAETAVLQEVHVFGEARAEVPERVQRAAALPASMPVEEYVEPEALEPEQEVELYHDEPEPDLDTEPH